MKQIWGRGGVRRGIIENNRKDTGIDKGLEEMVDTGTEVGIG